MKSSKPIVRNLAVDVLRILAIFAVVLIHTTSRSLEVSHFDIMRIWFTLYLNQFARFAVPMLFLISGYVLSLNYKDNKHIKKFYRKRLSKLLLPYFFWSIIYFLFIYKHSILELFSLNFLYQFLTGSASEQLYFIPAILLLYIIFPILQKLLSIYKSSSILFIFGSIFELILLSVNYYISPLPLVVPIQTALVNLNIFSFGIIVMYHQEKIMMYLKRRSIFILIVTLLSFSVLLYEVWRRFIDTRGINYIYDQWRPTVYIYTIFLSASLLYYLDKIRLIRYKKIILWFSQVSFFVFFIHIVFIYIYWHVLGSYLFSKSSGHIVDNVWFDPMVFSFTLGSSLVTAYILQFIPKLKHVVGLNT